MVTRAVIVVTIHAVRTYDHTRAHARLGVMDDVVALAVIQEILEFIDPVLVQTMDPQDRHVRSMKIRDLHHFIFHRMEAFPGLGCQKQDDKHGKHGAACHKYDVFCGFLHLYVTYKIIQKQWYGEERLKKNV